MKQTVKGGSNSFYLTVLFMFLFILVSFPEGIFAYSGSGRYEGHGRKMTFSSAFAVWDQTQGELKLYMLEGSPRVSKNELRAASQKPHGISRLLKGKQQFTLFEFTFTREVKPDDKLESSDIRGCSVVTYDRKGKPHGTSTHYYEPPKNYAIFTFSVAKKHIEIKAKESQLWDIRASTDVWLK